MFSMETKEKIKLSEKRVHNKKTWKNVRKKKVFKVPLIK